MKDELKSITSWNQIFDIYSQHSGIELFILIIKSHYKFFTLWTCFLSILYFFTKNSTLLEIISIAWIIVLLGGFYITYIHPKYLKIKELNIKIEYPLLRQIDVLVHVLPTLFLWYFNYDNIIKLLNQNTILKVNLLLIIYLSINNPFEIYDLDKNFLYIIIYILVFLMSINYFI